MKLGSSVVSALLWHAFQSCWLARGRIVGGTAVEMICCTICELSQLGVCSNDVMFWITWSGAVGVGCAIVKSCGSGLCDSAFMNPL